MVCKAERNPFSVFTMWVLGMELPIVIRLSRHLYLLSWLTSPDSLLVSTFEKYSKHDAIVSAIVKVPKLLLSIWQVYHLSFSSEEESRT